MIILGGVVFLLLVGLIVSGIKLTQHAFNLGLYWGIIGAVGLSCLGLFWLYIFADFNSNIRYIVETNPWWHVASIHYKQAVDFIMGVVC